MVSKNKVPANWPAGLEMADKIAAMIQEFNSRHPDIKVKDPVLEEALLIFDEIGKLVGMDE